MLFNKLALTSQQIVNKKLFTWGLNSAGQLGYNNIPTSFAQISAGQSHTLAITNTGLLFAWGLGTSGQLGDSTAVTKSSPVLVTGGITNWKQITTGDTFSLGVTNDGKLYAWGNNANSQLGNISTINRSAPTQVAAVGSWNQVTAGSNHVLAIANTGLLYGWGLNTSGQIGAISNYSQSWSQISVGPSHIMAIRDNGNLYGWGLNTSGQIGDISAISKSSPVQLGSGVWSKVSTGSNYTLAIRVDGSLWGWGLNTNYQLGDTTTSNKNSPVQIAAGKSFINVAAGFDHSLAIDTSSKLYTWGNLSSIAPNILTPTTIYSWTQVSKGSGYTVAIRSDGLLFTWGLNNAGQLGDSTTINKSSPVQVGTNSWTKVSAGASHVVAIDINSTLYTWGLNSSGQLADGSIVNKSTPSTIGISSWSQISAGSNFTTAINIDGKLFASGNNASNQLGDGSTNNRSTLVQISASVPSTSWSQISAGFDHSLATSTAGTLYSWGNYVAMGSVTIEPTRIYSWTQVSQGVSHTLAIRSDGLLFAWGGNTSGQMGVGSGLASVVFSSPVQVGTSSWSQISAGGFHSLGLTTTNSLFAWGWNNLGQVAQPPGTTIVYTPTGVGGTLGTINKITAGYQFSMAGNTLNQLQAWGYNAFGALGDGTTITKSTPVQIAGSWTSISAGIGGAVGISSTGTAFTWGSNINGQLGNNSTITRSTPVSLGVYSKVYMTNNTLFAIDSLARLWAAGLHTGDGTTIKKSTPVQIAGSWTSIGNSLQDTILGIKTDGSLWIWGQGEAAAVFSTPVQVGSSSWTTVTAQGNGGVILGGIASDGRLYQWGSTSTGGTGGAISPVNTSYLSPTLIGNNEPNSLGNFPNFIDNVNSYTQVAAGTSFSLAIRNNNQLYAWGLNSSGQLGTNNTTNLNVITQIGQVNTSSWTQVSAGSNTVSAISSDNKLYVWGSNSNGRLGDNTTINKSTPVQIAGSWINITAGLSSIGAIQSDFTMYNWGLNSSGEMGDSTTINKSSPVIVGNSINYNTTIPTLVAGNTSWNQISVGTSYQLATDNYNNLYTWGTNTAGQLSLNNDTIARSSPVFVRSNTVQISAGQSHAALVNSIGQLFAWGLNSTGQLGDASTIDKSSPVQIGTETSWITVVAGSTNTIAINTTSKLYTWGQNLNGELGSKDNISQSSPTQIGNLSWSVVGTQGSTTAAIRSDGNTFVWGANATGILADVTNVTKSSPVQLGNNPVNASSPVQVLSGGLANSWIQVSAAGNYTIGIDKNYQLYAWGENTLGKLGDNSSDIKNSPVLIDAKTSWLLINAGLNHVFAIDYNNSLYGWGRNIEGQIGDGSTISKSTPVLIAGPNAYKVISAGNITSAGINMNNLLYSWGNNSTGQLSLNDTINRSSPTQVGTSSWTQVSTGGTQAHGILVDRTLFTWGTNTNGTLGDNTTVTRSSPVLVTGTLLVSQSSPVQLGALSWSKISSSLSHTLAVRSDGLMFGWGLNSSGQLGLQSDTIARSSPTQIGTGSSWKLVAAGAAHSLAVRSDDKLYAWGLNSSGQIGLTSDTIARSSPVLVTSFSWNTISAGASHSVGITSDNSLFAWGNNSTGQLGITSVNAAGDTLNRSAPTQVQVGVNWYTVSAGQSHTVAINTDYNLYAWGFNTNFQLGDNTTVAKSSPVLISASSWSQVSAGTDHNLAISVDGTLWAWGSNTLGQLGLYTIPYSWTQVAEGNSFTAAIRSDGLLFTWGLNSSGQLGTGDTLNRSSPTQIGTKTWNQVFASANNMGVIDDTGTAYIWGNNLLGQIGDGTQVSKSSPVLVSGKWTSITAGTDHTVGLQTSGYLYTWGGGATGQTAQLTDVYSWSIVSENNSHTLAIRSDSKLFGWGLNSTGQLGINDTIARSSPVQIGNDAWFDVSSGGTHSLAIKGNRLLFAWGNNLSSQLGDNSTINKSSPVQIGTNSWTQVTAGSSHSLAIDSTGSLYGWGRGVEGQLGLLTTTYSWSTISAGATHATGIRSDGILFVWGLNSSGQLGLTIDTIARSSPIQLGTSNWSVLSNGSTHSLAIRTDGRLFAWGDNTGGQLGQSVDTIARSSPVQIGTNSWTSVSAGNSFTLAINDTNKLYAWGLNSSSQFGDGTTLNKSSPIQIGTNNWSSISAGFNHTAGIDSLGRLFVWGSSAGIGLVVEPQSWIAINSGQTATHVLAIRNDGLLFAWGTNAGGQLGTNDALTRSSPVQIGTSSWTSVDVGTSYSFAIRSDGLLFGWGLNSSGQLGLSTDTIARSSPVQIGISSWSQVSTGVNFVLGRTTDSKLFAWGANNLNQLGDGTTVTRSVPTQITIGTSYNQVSAGADHSLAIRNDGKLYGWGNSVALSNLTDLNSWTQVSEGPSHTVAIRNDSTLWAWGLNSSGQLGDNSSVNKSSPVQIGTGSWSNVSAGDNHTLAINTVGQMFAWGSGTSMQTGLGGVVTATQETLSRSSPIQIGTTASWSNVYAGTSYSLAKTTTSLLYGWGLNTSNQLGDGTTIAKSSPIQIGSSNWTQISEGTNHVLGIDALGKLYVWGSSTSLNLLTNTYSWSQVSEGGSHTLAIRNDGLLFAWGGNASGQLGDNSAILKSSPVQIGTGSWSSVSAGLDHSLAINSVGQLFAWGGAASMQTGLGGTVTAGQETLSRSSPIQIGTAVSWSQVSAGTSYSLARTTTELLYGWGINSSFQLGLGTDTLARSSPVQIGTTSWTTISAGFDHSLAIDSSTRNIYVWGNATSVASTTPVFSWTQVSQSSFHVLAIRNDGLLFAWGVNSAGQLGLTTDTIARSSPVQIGTSSWSNISAGDSHSLAIRSDGLMFGWGNNASGQLGLTTDTIARSSPVQIGTGSWSQVSAGASYSVARTTTNLLYAWGLNSSSQLGLGNTVARSSPVQIGTSSWNQVSAGFDHVLGIDNNTNLYAWGNPNATLSLTSQFSWTQVFMGDTHSIAIRSDGLLFTWGNNANGQLGDGTTVSKQSPVQIGTGSWSTAAPILNSGGTTGSTVAINSLGQMFTWGINNTGHLGDGTTINKSSPVQIGIPNSWSQVTGGLAYGLARTTTGLLYGWGFNTSSQIGDGTIVSKSSPVQIGTSSWSQVSALDNHTLGIDSNSNLYAWGNSSAISLMTSLYSWSQVSEGASHTLAIRSDGLLFGWGLNTSGQLGQLTDLVSRSSPVQIGSSSWTSVSAGVDFSTAIRTDGTLWAWGINGQGQLGISTDVLTRSSPVQVGTSSWAQVSAGNSFTIAKRLDNTLWAWGLNSVNQLGDGTVVNRSVPVQLSAKNAVGTVITSWSTISAGSDHSMAIDAVDRNLYTWGNSLAVGVQPGIFSWTKISSGASHTVAIRNDGLLFAWGVNGVGQLGIGTDTLTRSSPIQVGTSSWTNVNAGFDNSYAIRVDGGLFAWGNNAGGVVGDGTTINKSNPVQISAGTSWSLVAGGQSFAHAIRLDGGLFAWGLNSSGQLGLSTDTIARSAPVQLGTTSWTFVANGGTNGAGIRSDGTIYSWGNNAVAQLGDNTTISKSSPVLVTGGLAASATVPGSWTQVAVGTSAMVAIKDVGTIFAWGLNATGQLGDGTTVNKSSPVLVTGGLAASATVPGSWTQVRADLDNHITAIKSDSTLWGWGLNNAGQLGDNTTINKSSPVQVSGAGTWSEITSGSSFTVALKSDKTLFAWGLGTSALIDGTTVARSSPVIVRSGINYNTTSPALVSTGQSWTSVSAGQSYSLAIRNDSTMWGWGVNTLGQIADNTAVTKSSPVQVTTALVTSWSQVKASNSTAFAIGTDNKLYGWGQQAVGQLNIGGTGTDTLARSVPVLIGASSWSQVSAWASSIVAVRSDGILFAWGLNSSGQTGDSSAVNKSSPVLVRSLNFATTSPTLVQTNASWSLVSAGSSFSLAIRNDSTMWGWGLNNLGQTGDNTTINKSSPTQVNTGLVTSWSQVKAANSTAFAISTTNLLYGWGQQAVGQLNIGGTGTDTLARSAPVLIGSSSWTSVNITASAVGAIRSDGILFAWGLNNFSQIGDGTLANKSSPVLVRSLNLITTSPTLLQVGNSWSIVSAGQSYSAAIKLDGSLYTWGLNNTGQLGQTSIAGGDTLNRSSPSQVGTSSWAMIKAGASTTLGITSTGSLFAWGLNSLGQFGDGTTISKSSPVQISGTWSTVTTLGANSTGINSLGILFAWGPNSQGQTGDLSIIGRSSPVFVRNLLPAVTTPTLVTTSQSWNVVSAGQGYSLAINNIGLLYGWGLNNLGQTADNSAITKSSPTQISIGGSWSQVKAANNTAFAISTNNLLYGWGQQAIGQLNIGGTGTDTLARSAAVQIGTSSWAQVGAWASSITAIRSDGILFGWGLNTSGQIADNTVVNKSSPVLVTNINLNVTTPYQIYMANGLSWSTVAAGASFSTAIRSDGLLYAWGLNNTGQLGIGTDLLTRSSPVLIGTSSWSQISAGLSHTLAIDITNKLYGWGLNATGQLGTNDAIARSNPTQIGTSSWSQVTAGSSTTFALTSDKNIYTWGNNGQGQFGDSSIVARSSPVIVTGINYNTTSPVQIANATGLGNSSWSQVSVGASHSLAVNNVGLLYAWGLNNAGQLGITSVNASGDTFNRSAPTQVTAITSWSAISAGNSFTNGITSTGLLYGWGLNTSGQLALADAISRSAPTQVLGGGSWTQTYAANAFGGAIRSDGTVYQWGLNTNLNFADNTTVARSSPSQLGGGQYINLITNSPVQVKTGQSFSQVSAGNSFTMAIRTDGALFAWGLNSSYQLGLNNDSFTRSSPIQIGSLSWSSVSAGYSHAGAITNTNQLWTFGAVTPINTSSPVQITSGTGSFSQVSAGLSYTLARDINGILYAWGQDTSGQLGYF